MQSPRFLAASALLALTVAERLLDEKDHARQLAALQAKYAP